MLTDLLTATPASLSAASRYEQLIDLIQSQPEPWPWCPRKQVAFDAFLTAVTGVPGPHLVDAQHLADGTAIHRIRTVDVARVASWTDAEIESVVASWSVSPCWDSPEVNTFDLWGLMYTFTAYCKNTNVDGCYLWVVEAPTHFCWGYGA